MITEGRIRELLELAKLRAWARERDEVGLAADVHRCPIATYLSDETGLDAKVNGVHIGLYEKSCLLRRLRTPAPVADIVDAVDEFPARHPITGPAFLRILDEVEKWTRTTSSG